MAKLAANLALLLGCWYAVTSTCGAAPSTTDIPRVPAVDVSIARETKLAAEDYRKQVLTTRYATLRYVPEDMKPMWEKVLLFAVPSVSREVNLDDQVPIRLPGTDLYRLNLAGLGWDENDFIKFVGEKYPYYRIGNPMVVRGDWLVHFILDSREAQAYYALIYGSKKIPKNRQEMFAFFKVREDQQRQLGFGLIGQDSPVSISGERWIEHWAVDSGYAWQTKDLKKIKGDEGPLDNPDGKFKFDGTELIIGIPKVSAKYRSRGTLQIYQLGNNKEDRVEEAPADLVRDYIGYNHANVIVNSVSCHQCHAGGINDPHTNGLEKAIIAGVELHADFDTQQFLERFHLTDVGKELRRNQEDFTTAVYACNQLDAKNNSLYLRGAINWYTSELNLTQLARELDSTDGELQLALGYASAAKLPIGARFAGLAHGRPVSRDTVETGFEKLREVIKIWRSR